MGMLMGQVGVLGWGCTIVRRGWGLVDGLICDGHCLAGVVVFAEGYEVGEVDQAVAVEVAFGPVSGLVVVFAEGYEVCEVDEVVKVCVAGDQLVCVFVGTDVNGLADDTRHVVEIDWQWLCGVAVVVEVEFVGGQEGVITGVDGRRPR